jgi:hypothetical protein
LISLIRSIGGNGKIIKSVGLENWDLRMGIPMKGISKEVWKRDLGGSTLTMETDMRVISGETSFMVGGSTTGEMGQFMRVNLSMGWNRDMGIGNLVCRLICMISMKEITWMEKKMGLGFIGGLMGRSIKGFLRMIWRRETSRLGIKMGKLLNFYGRMGSLWKKYLVSWRRNICRKKTHRS